MRIEDLCTFGILEHTTSSRPGRPLTRIEVAKYNIDTAICPLSCLKAYIVRTKELRVDESKLIISQVEPNKAVSRDNSRRWTKDVVNVC